MSVFKLRYIHYTIVLLLLLSFHIGCDNECVNCGGPYPADCTFGSIAESECLGHDIANSCLGFFCRTEPQVFVPQPLILFCTEIDCSTMECSDDKIFTDLNFDEENILTATVIENGEILGNARCSFVQN